MSTLLCRSVRPDETRPPSGSCHGSPVGSTSAASPSGPRRAATCGASRGSSHGSARYGGWAVSRSFSTNPADSDAAASASTAGQGRSGFTWSGVSGETPPQSSTPAASSARVSARSTRLGGACTRMRGPITSRVTATAARYSSSPTSGVDRMAVSSFARKFWTITSCRWPWRRCTARRANTVSARSCSVSPMPTSNPDVNGTDSRPASSSTCSRTAGSLSGLPSWAFTAAVVSSIIPIDGATGLSRCSSLHVMTPGLRWGSSPVSSSTATAQART